MSRISNKFFITAIEDGSTIHGILNSTKPLSQSWSGSSAAPDWEIFSNRPIVYLSVTKNGSEVDYDSIQNIEWYYNGTKLTFDNEDLSTNSGCVGYFESVQYFRGEGSDRVTYNGLRICKNLARQGNTDVDIIKVTGSIESNGSQIPFSASKEVKIVEIQGGGAGYFGQILFANDTNIFTNDISAIVAYGVLYKSGDSSPMSINDYEVRWYINGTRVTNGSNTNLSPRLSGQSEQIDDKNVLINYPGIYFGKDDIVDIAVIKAEFLLKGQNNVVYTAYDVVDDKTDMEYLWITYDNDNGGTISLREGDDVTFNMWVGQLNDPKFKYTEYKYFYVLLLDSNGNEIEGEVDEVQNVTNELDIDNYRKIYYDEKKEVASLTIGYKSVSEHGGSITGIILAQSTNPNEEDNE